MKRVILGTFLSLSLCSSAWAIDWATPILDENNVVMKTCVDESKPDCQKPITLGKVVSTALWALGPNERDPRTGASTLPGEESFKRSVLALKIHNGEITDLSAEDITLIKRLVASTYPPLTIMRVYQLIDPKVSGVN